MAQPSGMHLRSKPSNPVIPPPELSRTHVTAAPSATTAPKESDADARLRDRDMKPSSWPRKEEVQALGGRRRIGGGSGKLRKREWYILGIVCAIATVVRLWKLSHPSSVV